MSASASTSCSTVLLNFARSNELFTPKGADPDLTSLGWQIAAEPFVLSHEQLAFLEKLGPVLWQFQQAQESLYFKSLNGRLPAWLHQTVDAGKPADLLDLARSQSLKGELPRVLRPDLLLTDKGWALCEIDAVPGGLGFTSALNAMYKEAGFSVVESEQSLPLAFADWLSALLAEKTGKAADEIKAAIIISDEAEDYYKELNWLVETIKERHSINLYLVKPESVTYSSVQAPSITAEAEPVLLDGLYRFYELFDRDNVQKLAQLETALVNQQLAVTPPPKPWLEEKAWLAFLHHPDLKAAWLKAMGEAGLSLLKQITPESWLLEPSGKLYPDLTGTGLKAQKAPIVQWLDLTQASQKERQLVVKPSGFSPLGWGSRGVTIGHDKSATVWTEKLQEALGAFETTPHLLQRYEKPRTVTIDLLDPVSEQRRPMEGRVRLCPYYLAYPNDEVKLAGILATVCPKDKKIIHGMKVAAMAPCTVQKD